MTIDPRAWRKVAENRIEEAIKEGAFDNLPGFGKPLVVNLDDDENGWLREKARREKLNLLPPALELAKLVERRLVAIRELESGSKQESALRALNEYINRANMRITWGPPSTVLPIRLEDFFRDA
jgi:Domain of unknown function (DUF1992)